ncbi:MAG: ABC transporter permease [Lachnospiraceae bacterium]
MQKKYFMNDKKLKFGDYLNIEIIKIRRNKIFPILLIAPILVVVSGISALSMYLTPEYPDPWAAMFIQSSLLFSYYLLPLSMVVVCVMLHSREQQANGILKMLSLPVDKTKMVLAKFMVVVIYLIIEMLIFLVVFTIAGLYTSFTNELITPAPIGYILKWSSLILISMLPSIAVMWAITVRFSKIFISVGLNFLFTIPGILFSALPVWYLFPYCYSGHIIRSAISSTNIDVPELPFNLIPFIPVAFIVFIVFLFISIKSFGKYETQ